MTDRVFADNGAGGLKFVGDFDGLYSDEEDPWEQSGSGDSAEYYRESRARLINALRHVRGRGLEVGCGHGHVLAEMRACLLGVDWSGLDVSGVAVMQARRLYPGLAFYQGSIESWRAPEQFDVVILNQCLWYILESFDQAITNCLDSLTDRGLLVLSQAFLRVPQLYGADICNGFHGTLATLDDKFGGRMTLIEARYDDGDRFPFHDGLMVFRKR